MRNNIFVSTLISSIPQGMKAGKGIKKALFLMGIEMPSDSQLSTLAKIDFNTLSYEIGESANDINEIYAREMSSCMKNKEVGEFWEFHGVECHAIPKARALVCPIAKTFYRCYGENHYILETLLEVQGYTKTSNWVVRNYPHITYKKEVITRDKKVVITNIRITKSYDDKCGELSFYGRNIGKFSFERIKKEILSHSSFEKYEEVGFEGGYREHLIREEVEKYLEDGKKALTGDTYTSWVNHNFRAVWHLEFSGKERKQKETIRVEVPVQIPDFNFKPFIDGDVWLGYTEIEKILEETPHKSRPNMNLLWEDVGEELEETFL